MSNTASSVPVPKQEIVVGLTTGKSGWAIGSYWRIKAKKSDFYLETVGPSSGHISLHGPQGDHKGHRFHIKADRSEIEKARAKGHFVEHGVPPGGQQFEGKQLRENVFLAVRLRWTWDLQRDKFRRHVWAGEWPALGKNRSGLLQHQLLGPNEAWDVDLVVSYDKPYWPNAKRSERDQARLGPVRNNAGMWLTGTSVLRKQGMYPSPPNLVLPLPKPDETPNRISAGGLGHNGAYDMYWFVESVTSRELLEQVRRQRYAAERSELGTED